MRVVTAQDVAHHGRALEEATVGPVAAVEHGVQDPAVHGFEPVAHIGQCPTDDHAHRVVQVGLLHLRLEFDRLDAVGVWSLCQQESFLDVEETNVFGVALMNLRRLPRPRP